MAGEVDARLAKLGIDVPDAAAPVANYVGYVQTGNLVFVSGQVPIKDGKFQYQGKLGESMSVEDAQAAARLCAINIVSQVKAACGGDLDRVQRVVKLTGFVNSTGDFTDQPKVINGASATPAPRSPPPACRSALPSRSKRSSKSPKIEKFPSFRTPGPLDRGTGLQAK